MSAAANRKAAVLRRKPLSEAEAAYMRIYNRLRLQQDLNLIRMTSAVIRMTSAQLAINRKAMRQLGRRGLIELRPDGYWYITKAGIAWCRLAEDNHP